MVIKFHGEHYASSTMVFMIPDTTPWHLSVTKDLHNHAVLALTYAGNEVVLETSASIQAKHPGVSADDVIPCYAEIATTALDAVATHPDKLDLEEIFCRTMDEWKIVWKDLDNEAFLYSGIGGEAISKEVGRTKAAPRQLPHDTFRKMAERYFSVWTEDNDWELEDFEALKDKVDAVPQLYYDDSNKEIDVYLEDDDCSVEVLIGSISLNNGRDAIQAALVAYESVCLMLLEHALGAEPNVACVPLWPPLCEQLDEFLKENNLDK